MKPRVSSRPPLSRPSAALSPRPIAGIPWQVWASGPIPSNPNLEGSFTGLFDNTTGELDFDGDLIMSKAACLGLVNE
ncbi:hypothetical protein AB0L33_21915 [Streptomyces sp. NPDC052299]|uniref:hypothetical protein n=1 Tax=Streptomyces sp. NPDC052299 TaxID=3155054 RepID=UPI00341BC7D4